MRTCPVCGTEGDTGLAECPRCHLPVELFEPVSEVAGGSTAADHAYLEVLSTLLTSVETPDEEGSSTPPPAQAVISRPARFPSTRPAESSSPSRSMPLSPSHSLPALPPASERSALRRQVAEFLQLARRQGIDTIDFRRRVEIAASSDDLPSLELLSRELFASLASALSEEFDLLVVRRNELAGLVPGSLPDTEVEGCRAALNFGDLGGAQRRIRQTTEELSQLEEEWEVTQILLAQTDLLKDSLRTLGGDPSAVEGPVAEGRRLVIEGKRTEAERVLARATLALWTLLQPRLFEDLERIRSRLEVERKRGANLHAATEEIRRIATEIRRHNYAGTVDAYRRLRALVDGEAAGRARTVGGDRDASVAVPQP